MCVLAFSCNVIHISFLDTTPTQETETALNTALIENTSVMVGLYARLGVAPGVTRSNHDYRVAIVVCHCCCRGVCCFRVAGSCVRAVRVKFVNCCQLSIFLCRAY